MLLLATGASGRVHRGARHQRRHDCGRITYDGTPPKPEKVTITQDPGTCGTSRELDELEVSSTGGVKDAVVYLVDIKSGKKMDLPAKPELD